MADIPPPRLPEPPIPVHRPAQTLLDARLLLPAQPAQLGAVHGVAPVVEGPVVRVLHPTAVLLGRVVRDAHGREDLAAEREVGDLVAGADVVDLAGLAFMQDGVERVGGVGGVEVPPSRAAVAVEDYWLAPVEEACEFGYDF